MISDARGGHVSPGIYTEERDVTYSVKSLGITSLGAVGETLKGPAFQNIPIESWAEFVDYFGGTSTEKFKGNGRPKYELPYIAKAYLEESRRLNVVRVLGLSGYDAGPAWVMTAGGKPVLVLRSKMSYSGASQENYCEFSGETPTALVDTIKKIEYSETVYDAKCAVLPEKNTSATAKNTSEHPLRFGIEVTAKNMTVGASGQATEGNGSIFKYNVSLDPTDKRYIYNVLPKDPKSGESLIYIDSVFEGNLAEVQAEIAEYNKNLPEENKKIEKANEDKKEGEKDELKTEKVVVLSEFDKKTEVDFKNYKEGFRAAMTPWIVSNVDANDKVMSMKKLFRAITISDGNAANYQVKISIQRIDPFKGTFDLVVRDFYDTDEAPLILEKFSNCNMVEGDAGYVGFKVGTADGGYVNKSKYITLEMAEGEGLEKCVPAGFLGYPSVFGSAITLNYNTEYNGYQKARKQYFGITPSTVETDILDYKGVAAYTTLKGDKLSNGFHMDSILNADSKNTIHVDGESGYTFTTVSAKKQTAGEKRIPRIIAGTYIEDTLYKDINLRKFTVYPYGGFDGWDINREERTNTDNYSAINYPVGDNATSADTFTKLSGEYLDMLNLSNTAITSDFYAYLGGYRQFANPEDVDINVFVTPGIDWLHNGILTDEALSIIEDTEDGRGGDALYVMDSPQYNNGEQISADEIARELENSGIDTSYGCTYFPWIKFFDTTQKKYIDLPVTKDVVRNMAKTDNNSYPWFAPAGIDRGSVVCQNAVKKTTLAEEDDLYEVGINPVKSFAQDGVKVWGNKTLYSADSPLNRINVRRLMIRVKKLIKEAAKNLIFEQYDATLEKQFRNLVEPILSNVKDNRGISDYRLQIESSAEARDEHILPAKILIKPTPALEYISLSFVVYPESVEFED